MGNLNFAKQHLSLGRKKALIIKKRVFSCKRTNRITDRGPIWVGIHLAHRMGVCLLLWVGVCLIVWLFVCGGLRQLCMCSNKNLI